MVRRECVRKASFFFRSSPLQTAKLIAQAMFYVVFWSIVGIASTFADDIPIDQKHKEFLPNDVTIKAGDTLVFSNHDNRTHNIEIIYPDGGAKDDGLQKPDVLIRETFDKPGNYEVRCIIHPEMLLTVTVQ